MLRRIILGLAAAAALAGTVGHTMTRRILLTLCLFLVAANGTSSAQVLHAIIAADTNNADIGASVAVDAKAMVAALKNGLPANQLRIHVIPANKVTRQYLLGIVKTLVIDSRDSVLVYYSGHGGYTNNRGHHFALSNGERIDRSEMLRAITQPLTPRFYALITDCCASRVAGKPLVVPVPGAVDPTVLLRNLFFRKPGSVDINSSRPEQVSWGTDVGGAFTSSLIRHWRSNAGNAQDWSQVFSEVRNMTAQHAEDIIADEIKTNGMKNIHFVSGFPQLTQTVYSFRLFMDGERINGLRLGAIWDDNGRVVFVDPVGPVNLAPGDQIIRINGVPTKSLTDVQIGVYFSPKDMKELVFRRLGQNYSIQLELPY